MPYLTVIRSARKRTPTQTVTLSVCPTWAGDNRFFILTRDADGKRCVDSKPRSRLTKTQQYMASFQEAA